MNDEFLDELSKMGQIQEKILEGYRRNTDLFWYSLPQESKEMAFFYIVNKIVDLELNQNSSYRDVMAAFNFDYGLGVDSGFLRLHNAIYSDEEIEEIKIEAGDRAVKVANPYKVNLFKG